MIELTNSICFGLRAAIKKIDKTINDKLKPIGISIPQSFILINLLQEDGATLKDIGNKSLIDSSSMTVLVDKLEKKGLVERHIDTLDHRAIRVFITNKGKIVAGEVFKLSEEINNLLYDLIGEGNQKEFLHGINNIINRLE
jgi:DNA-binding MarR family transcriptional regulator